MKIPTERVPVLRSMLDGLNERRAAAADLNARIGLATDAASRLRDQIASLDREAMAIANAHIPSDADRVEKLLAGVDLLQIDKKEVEQSALDGHLVTAKIRQLLKDLDGVIDHISALKSQAASDALAIKAVEVAFLHALGSAMVEVYKRDAVDFVSRHAAPLKSIANQIGEVTGERPAWENRVLNQLSIRWNEDEPVQPSPHHPIVHPMVMLWPRYDGVLVSGERVDTTEALDNLIREILAAPSKAAVA